MEKVIIGLDQSTSGTKLVIVNRKGNIIYRDGMEHQQYYPVPGYVEHDMNEIYDNCLSLLNGAQNHIQDSYEIETIAITNQRETIVFWDKNTGQPLCNGLVWQCRRGRDICEAMSQEGKGTIVQKKTGLKLDPYFSGSKIKWALDKLDPVKVAASNGTLLIGTVDSYLIYRLTGGKAHLTDHTNASRTLLYNIHEGDWDKELLDLFGVSRSMLPDIIASNGVFGMTKEGILRTSATIIGVIGDSQGALFGQMCFNVGDTKATYGTGSSLMMYTGRDFVRSDKGIMTSVAWSEDEEVHYCIEGMINSSGDTLKWVKDNLGLYERDQEVDEAIASLDSSEGVYIIPAFSGLGAPYWKTDARAGIVGMSRKSNKAHIIRAAVESMAYQVADLIHVMEEEAGRPIALLNVDGGPTKNDYLMQLQSDLLDIKVRRGSNQELSVLGAIYLAGLKTGYWESRQALMSLMKVDREFSPVMTDQKRQLMMDGWHEALARVF